MAHTPLFSALERWLHLASAAEKLDRDTGEFLEEWSARRLSRRRFLESSIATAAGLALLPAASAAAPPGASPTRVRPDSRRNAPSIAIVGAGIAGLTCAYTLRKQGLASTIFEASTRVGGRMSTARRVLADGQVAELGGELMDSAHETIRGLAAELGIQVDDLFTNEPAGFRRDTWYFGDRLVSEKEIVDLFRPVAAQMAAIMAEADASPEARTHLDNTSLAAWLHDLPELPPLLDAILTEAFIGEFGLELSEQSALNLLTMIDYETPDPFRIFGESDERYHTHLGNDTITTALAGRLNGRIETGTRLMAIGERPDGRIRLTLSRGGSSFHRDFDTLVLALPFTMLRKVEITWPLPADKRKVIDELGYGTNAKVMGQFTERTWRTRHNASGSTVTDLGFQTLWDTSRGQSGNSGILTNFLGGNAGRDCGQGTPEERITGILGGIDRIYPGARSTYRAGSALRMHWPTAPFHQGSYACYKPGQWAFQGIEGRRERNILFCGEHTSVDYQGFMEGGCETGVRAASEIIEDARLPVPAR